MRTILISLLSFTFLHAHAQTPKADTVKKGYNIAWSEPTAEQLEQIARSRPHPILPLRYDTLNVICQVSDTTYDTPAPVLQMKVKAIAYSTDGRITIYQDYVDIVEKRYIKKYLLPRKYIIWHTILLKR
jgi:hypothetical protein